MIRQAFGIVLLAIMLITLAAGVSVGCNKKNKVNNEENNMTITAPKIPPIDTVIPVKTETATFALG